MKEELRRLPDSELEVMQAVWNCKAPIYRQDIEQHLHKEMAMTTLLTLLSRLAEKGYLQIEKEERRSCYMPLVSREEYQTIQSRRFFEQVFDGNVSAFAAALCAGGIDEADIRELKRLLEEGKL